MRYYYQGNKLTKVIDPSLNTPGFKDGTNTGDDYTYDDNGNLISDANKDITEIKYNHLNQPIKITFANDDEIRYIYDANGQKLIKYIESTDLNTETEYFDGFQYVDEDLKFFPHAEGYVNVLKTTPEVGPETVFYNYVFNYTDHLGNIRVSYGYDPSDEQLEMLEENNYYPFGLKHRNYNLLESEYSEKYAEVDVSELCSECPKFYKYKYNGKEWQDELGLGWYDYGARNYDPALGRWMNIDPLAEQGRRWSPYSYVSDNPIYYIDPDGMWKNPFKGLGTAIVNTIVKDVQEVGRVIKPVVKKVQNTVVTTLKKADAKVHEVLGGVSIWVGSNDQKQDGLVKPAKAADRGKVKDLDGSALESVNMIMNKDSSPPGRSLKERTEGVTNLEEKADAASDGTSSGSSGSSIQQQSQPEMVEMKYYTEFEITPTGPDGASAPGGVMVKAKDTTTTISNKASIDEHNKKIFNRNDGKTIYGDY